LKFDPVELVIDLQVRLFSEPFAFKRFVGQDDLTRHIGGDGSDLVGLRFGKVFFGCDPRDPNQGEDKQQRFQGSSSRWHISGDFTVPLL
jgi:hypothetical protein